MLQLNSAWRLDAPASLPAEARWEFDNLMGKVIAQLIDKRWETLEHFKYYFSVSGGSSSSRSSSESWAESDLNSALHQAAENAPLFIEAFYEACESLRAENPNIAVPDAARINKILHEHNCGFQLQPPQIIETRSHVSIAVPVSEISIDQRAQEMFGQCLTDADSLLAQGKGRQAVQELLWLLETFTTAFEGVEINDATIKGSYFNKIADDLQRNSKGRPLERVIDWVKSLHGFLSATKGGAVRHGAHVVDLKNLTENEAQLYCDLIKSYVAYLIAEHRQLNEAAKTRR